MGIRIKDKDVTKIYLNGKRVLSVYINGLLIWPYELPPIIGEILSCYSNGYWIDEYPWVDDTTWGDQ